MTTDEDPKHPPMCLPSLFRIISAAWILLPCVLMLSCSSPRPGQQSPVRGQGAPAPNTEGWYFSEIDMRMPEPGQAERRSWKPVTYVDPADVPGFQIMFELTRFPERVEATEDERERADQLRIDSVRSARRHGWFDSDQAVRDGFHLMFIDDIHYVKEDFATDDGILDPERPEFLMFYQTDYGKRLVAYMYLARHRDERGPQMGGPLTLWHHHFLAKPICHLHDLIWAAFPGEDGQCSVGTPHNRSPEMMHVWFIDHPQGPFSTRMELPPETRVQIEGKIWPPQRFSWE